MVKILIIEDDVPFCEMLSVYLKKRNYNVSTAYTAGDGLKKLQTEKPELVITDVRLPDQNGLEILKNIKTDHPKLPVILMTGYAEIQTAVSAIQEGASDYMEKPVRPDQLLALIEKVLKNPAPISTLDKKETTNPAPLEIKPITGNIQGVGEASKQLQKYIGLVAPTPMSVLIIGDSGTGKEFAAKSIHDNSKRSDASFIAVDCGAIPKEIASSEFFGHLKGSFTGAINDKKGHFEAADGGTLFLDEIGNLGYELQVKLLRALQERVIKPVGSNEEKKIDIRVIAATNEDLNEAIAEGNFREDLYHRLNEFTIKMPSLRERKADLPEFIEFFLAQANNDLERQVTGFSKEALSFMTSYAWPGNLRELKNVVRRSVLLTQVQEIPAHILPAEILKSDTIAEADRGLYHNAGERELILDAVKTAGGNKSKAARILKIDRKTLYNKLKQYQINL
ncbi:MAG: sigma-54 dependent transcriptional regulator [Leeuwenhoekiella sp.]